MLLLSVLFMTAINPVSLRAEGQLSPHREKTMLANTIFFLLEQVEYTFGIYGAQIFPNDQLKYSIYLQNLISLFTIYFSFELCDNGSYY
jgi:hypothetical protein